MAAGELFDDPHAAEARERYGEAAVEVQRRAAAWDDVTAGAGQVNRVRSGGAIAVYARERLR